MEVRLDDIYVGDRLREEYDLSANITSYKANGQLQAVLIRPPREGEEHEDKKWVLVDGGRRYFGFKEIYASGGVIPRVMPGHIHVITAGEATPLQHLTWEFHANEDRKEFTWQEKAKYVRTIHAMFMEEQPTYWTVELSAQVLEMGAGTVYKYLQLTQDPEIFNNPEVQGADTFNTAYKKQTIVKEKKRRVSQAKRHDEVLEQQLRENENLHQDGDTDIDLDLLLHRMASLILAKGDCREWATKLPDGVADFIHWDPPYGNRGFAHSTHEYFEDTWEYASKLMSEVFPIAHRLLKDGHWMVVWHSPHKQEWVKRTLQGHRMGLWDKGDKFISCEGCGSKWDDLDDFLPCRGSDEGFWVNPIPYIWFKPNRQADGHEIKRFSLNQYEQFFLCAKSQEVEPILIDSSKSNVLTYDQISKSERRHATHKPPKLLQDIISRISVPGELCIDFSFGSGSIIEACLPMKRRISCVELDEGQWAGALEVTKALLKKLGITSLRSLKELSSPAKE